MPSTGRVYIPERDSGTLSEALATVCSDASRVSTFVRRDGVADGIANSVVVGGGTIDPEAVI